MKKERIVSLDVIRSVAIFLVVILHGISLGGALAKPMLTPAWTAALYLRQLATACVPLFLLLTGFLQSKKTLSAGYYLGIVPLYLSYAAISVITLLARHFGDPGFKTSLSDGVYRILNFTANDYSWYFEMYIGLFLLIPFLNLAYSGLKSKKQKLVLIATLFFLTMMPEVTKSFAPYYANGGVSLDIIPNYFTELYPVTYYFIGAYIAEHRPRPKRWIRVLMLVLAPALPTLLCCIFSAMRGEYAWYMMNGNAAPTALFTALAIFLFFYDVDFKNGFIGRVSKTLSDCTFEAYLFSFIFDSYVYGPGNVPARLERYFSQFADVFLSDAHLGLPAIISVALVFAGSVFAAYVLRKLLIKPATLLIRKFMGGKNENNPN